MRISTICTGLMALLILAPGTQAQSQGRFGDRKAEKMTAILARMETEARKDLQTIQVNGVERSYLLREPSQTNRKPDEVRPMVIVLHGGGGNAHNAEKMTGFTKKAEKEGFYVVYPNGSGKRGHILLTWNSTHCCGHAMQSRVDDVSFISALIDKLSKEYPIDSRRIYVTGMSNGAMMAHQLGIALSSRIAAIAPVVGGMFGDEQLPATPVSAMIFNGAKDENVPEDGGLGSGVGARKGAWDGTPLLPATSQGQFWAKADDCETDPGIQRSRLLTETSWTCPKGVSVTQVMVLDGGHSWPGGQPGYRRADRPSQAINATDAMWEFFQAHPKPQSPAESPIKD